MANVRLGPQPDWNTMGNAIEIIGQQTLLVPNAIAVSLQLAICLCCVETIILECQ